MLLKEKESLVSLSWEDLSSRLKVARRNVARLRMELMVGQLKNTSQYLLAKKDVARVMTAMAAKSLSEVVI